MPVFPRKSRYPTSRKTRGSYTTTARRAKSRVNSRATTKKLIKNTLMNMSETKVMNGVSDYVVCNHNGTRALPISTKEADRSDCDTHNLYYTKKGTDGNARIGDEVYGQYVDLDIQYNFPGKVESSSTATWAYSKNTHVRVVVFEIDYEKYSKMTATNVEDNLFKHPALYYPPIVTTAGSDSVNHRITAPLNTVDFRILRDDLFSLTSEMNYVPGLAVGSQRVWPASGFHHMRVPVNKNIYYPSANVSSKRLGMCLVGFNQKDFADNTDSIGDYNVSWKFAYKDM